MLLKYGYPESHEADAQPNENNDPAHNVSLGGSGKAEKDDLARVDKWGSFIADLPRPPS